MLGLDPLFILGSRQRGGPFVVHHPPTQGVFGVTEIVWRGAHPNFLGGPPKSCTGDDGFSSWHGGGTQRGRSGDTPAGGGGNYEPCGRDVSGGTPVWAPPYWSALAGGHSLTGLWGGCSSWILISGQKGSGGRWPGGKWGS